MPVTSTGTRDQIYDRLNANPQRLEIRLIELEPRSDPSAPLSCRMRRLALEDAPEYYALSYYWGAANDERCPIWVNGFEFKIQLNLYDALIALQRRNCTMIWADAICLNQDDDDEKAQQVPRMKLIYQRAKGVAIWLGKEADGSSVVIDMFKRLARTPITAEWNAQIAASLPEKEEIRTHVSSYYRAEYWISIVRMLLGRPELTDAMLQQEGLDQYVANTIDEFNLKMNAFFARPYWRRMWIIQEVAVARSVAIFCGDELLKWDDLLGTMILEARDVNWDDVSQVGGRHVDLIIKLRYKIKNSLPIGLLTALQYSCGFEAGREQDKIYGIIGLAWDAEQYVQTVSYGAQYTLARIMFDMTMLWVNNGFLDIMCLQPLSRYTDTTLPSWFPKWVSAGKGALSNRLIDFLEARNRTAFVPKFHHRWTATARSRSMYHEFLDDSRVLTVSGIHIDTIDGLSGTCDPEMMNDEELNKSWDSRNQAPESVQEMKRIRHDLYWTLCMYKADESQGIADQAHSLDFLFTKESREFLAREDQAYLQQWLDTLRNFKVFGRPLENWLLNRSQIKNNLKLMALNAMTKNVADRNDSSRHVMWVLDALKHCFDDGRRLMTTRAGRIGWAHPSARPGDRIYLIAGCNLPVILAPCNEACDGYQTCLVVGDAYVHGVMYGELWGQVYNQLTKIFLR
jgi:hypothetical protein